MADTEFLSATQVAQRLGVHPETVHRWRRDGTITAVRLPSGRYRYRADLVDAMTGDKP